MTRHVSKGFTRGNVLLDEIPKNDTPKTDYEIELNEEQSRLLVEFENENLNAVLKVTGQEDKLLAICPDLITVGPPFLPLLP